MRSDAVLSKCEYVHREETDTSLTVLLNFVDDAALLQAIPDTDSTSFQFIDSELFFRLTSFMHRFSSKFVVDYVGC